MTQTLRQTALDEARNIRPIDAVSDDPAIPRVVTIEDRGGGLFERVVTFPDGSTQCEFLPREEPRSPAGPDAPVRAEAAARRFAEAAAGTLLHDAATARWFAFDGAIWRREPHVTRRVRAALREAGVDDPAPGLVAAVEQLARSEPALQAGRGTVRDSVWDADPFRLGTPGGTVDLATGALRAADPGDRITRATAVAPAEATGAPADCPLWRRFLAETTGGDAALQNFLQRFCGYALTGDTCEHALLFGLGEGGNGKSVFVNTIRGIMGDYAAVAAPDLLAQGSERRAGKAHSAEVAMLAGARLVTASETEEGRVWADGRLKLLTGGDPVTARFLGRDPFTFTPRFKLLVVGNHMPVLRTVDAALRRRLCVVPFAHRPAVPDRRLEAKLRAEWPAILRWMIEGCLAWAAEGPDGGLCGGRAGGLSSGLGGGLLRPAAVATATDAYLAGQDLVAQFLAECCDRAPAHHETAAALYSAWCRFARAAGELPGTQRRLAARLDREGFVRERVDHARLYRGVRLVGDRETEATVREVRGG